MPTGRGNKTMLDDLPRGVPSRALHEHQTPAAAFADPKQIQAAHHLRYTTDKIFLGVIGGEMVEDRAGERPGERYVTGGTLIGLKTDQHVSLIAGSRGGKGISLVLPNLLGGYQGSVLVVDPKGELANLTATFRAAIGQRVAVLDPFKITRRQIARFHATWNPLTLLKRQNPTLVEDAGLIADALIVAGGERDTHWDESARAWIEGLILHIATWPAYDGRRNLITVRRLLMRGTDFELDGERFEGYDALRREMAANDAAGGAVQDAAADFFERPKDEQGSVLSTARRHTRFLAYQLLQDVLTGDDLDLAELKTAAGGMTIYLCLPAERMSTCFRWLRLFVNLTLSAMERTPVRPEVPVLLLLDEFAQLGHFRQLEVAAGQIAGFGVKLFTVLQDLTQLKRLYKESWETFLGNSGAIIAFGNNDVTTLDWLSKRLGKTSLIVERKTQLTHDARQKGASGDAWSNEVHDLMTAEEISRFFGRDDHLARMLVIRPGKDPMILQRVHYDRHPAFEGRFDHV